MSAIKTDFRLATLDTATRKMLEFVEQTTLEPCDASEARIEELRATGFEDADILDIVHVTGFFNHINRVADALGVDLEDFMTQRQGSAKE